MTDKPDQGSNLKDHEINAEIEFNKLVEAIGGAYHKIQRSDSQNFLKQTAIINEISQISDTFFLLLDQTQFKILFFSNNFDQFFGYSNEDLKKYDMLLFFKMINNKQLTFPMKMFKWHQENEKTFDVKERINGFQYLYSGVALNHKLGRRMKLLIQLHPLEMDNKTGNPLMSLLSIKDISGLYNGEHFWGRFSCGIGLKKVSYFHSSEKLAKGEDLFSFREKEILRLIHTGKTSKEIAEEFFLSQSTVEKHRKNVLKRTGFIDINGLFSVLNIDKIL